MTDHDDDFEYSFELRIPGKKDLETTTIVSPDSFFQMETDRRVTKCAGMWSHHPGGEHELDAKEPYVDRTNAPRWLGSKINTRWFLSRAGPSPSLG